MALILGALMIQGIQPGPQLVTEHADPFWGLIASFWIGNARLMVLNVPLIGMWVKLLRVPYRFLFPAAVFSLRSACTAPRIICHSDGTRIGDNPCQAAGPRRRAPPWKQIPVGASVFSSSRN